MQIAEKVDPKFATPDVSTSRDTCARNSDCILGCLCVPQIQSHLKSLILCDLSEAGRVSCPLISRAVSNKVGGNFLFFPRLRRRKCSRYMDL
jgi:hypothetical protein